MGGVGNMVFSLLASVAISVLTILFVDEYKRQKKGTERERIRGTVKDMAENGEIWVER